MKEAWHFQADKYQTADLFDIPVADGLLLVWYDVSDCGVKSGDWFPVCWFLAEMCAIPNALFIPNSNNNNTVCNVSINLNPIYSK